MGDEPHRPHALRLQRTQGRTYAAALRIAQQCNRARGSGKADIDRHIGGAPGQIGAVLGDTVRCERELGDDIGGQPLLAGQRQLLV
jgi:hypothetical protein